LTLIVEICVDPVGLNETDSDAPAETDIDASTDHHGESRDGGTVGLLHPTKQSVHKGLGNGKAGLQHRSDGVGVDSDVVSVCTAEVTRDAQDVFEVTGNRRVPTVGIEGRLEMGELVSTKEFDSLRRRAPAERGYHETDQDGVPDYSLGVVHVGFRSTLPGQALQSYFQLVDSNATTAGPELSSLTGLSVKKNHR